jgi:hypothetical protein
MEYKVFHSADLQADLDRWAAEKWELFTDPIPFRQPNNPALWLIVMTRDETSAMDFADSLTLAAISRWARDNFSSALPHGSDLASGYNRAVTDVLLLLEARGQLRPLPDTDELQGE